MSNKTVLTQNSDQDEIQNEYNNFIKESVLNGKYFKDGREWYIFKYITPICDRALLIISIAVKVFFSIFSLSFSYILL